MENAFAEIITNEGWNYNPEAPWQELAMQYWDYAQKLVEASRDEPNKILEQGLHRLATDYIVLAGQIVTERVSR